MIRVPARPSRPKAISMPSVRSAVWARRRRPASARGVFGQLGSLGDPPFPAGSAPMRGRGNREAHHQRADESGAIAQAGGTCLLTAGDEQGATGGQAGKRPRSPARSGCAVAGPTRSRGFANLSTQINVARRRVARIRRVDMALSCATA
jgi:hypothetical protein